MVVQPLPIAIVVPHAALAVPPELENRIILNEEQIFNEADVYADLIYDFRGRVLHWESFPIARALIDVNRPADQVLNHRPGDGVVKTKTSYGDAVFETGNEPDAALEKQLIERYWQPWHNRLAQIAEDKAVRLVLDCHSMAAIGPTTYEDPAQMRPRVTASNLGDLEGDKRPQVDKLTASPELTRSLADQLGLALADVPELAPTTMASAVNTPFWGGWNIYAHGGKNQPWIMVELNRALYIGPQMGSSPVVPPDSTRIATIRERIWQAIETVVQSGLV